MTSLGRHLYKKSWFKNKVQKKDTPLSFTRTALCFGGFPCANKTLSWRFYAARIIDAHQFHARGLIVHSFGSYRLLEIRTPQVDLFWVSSVVEKVWVHGVTSEPMLGEDAELVAGPLNKNVVICKMKGNQIITPIGTSGLISSVPSCAVRSDLKWMMNKKVLAFQDQENLKLF